MIKPLRPPRDYEDLFRFCGDPRAFEAIGVDFPLVPYLLIVACSLVVSIPAGYYWYRRRDYYPLKERSALLTVVMMVNFLLIVNTYPVMAVWFYLKDDPRPWPSDQFGNQLRFFRALVLTQQSMAFIVYILRSARILFAHRARPTQRSSVLFRLFQSESNLLLLLGLLLTLKLFPPLFQPFSFASPLDNPSYMQLYSQFYYDNERTLFQFREYFLLLYILLSSFLIFHQRRIKSDFALLSELLPLFILVFFAQIGKLVLYLISPFQSRCINEHRIPTVMLLEMLEAFICFAVSLLIPLWRSRPHHQILPGNLLVQQYRLLFSAFLSERLSLKVFHDFLLYQASRSREDNPYRHVDLLKFWMRTVRERISGAKLVRLSQFQRSLLKSSGLLNESEKQEQLPQQKANRALSLLFDVFVNRYKKTGSFGALRQILEENDCVNTNLVLMNMTTIERDRSSSLTIE